MTKRKTKLEKKIYKNIIVFIIYLLLVIIFVSMVMNLLSTDKSKGMFGYTARLVITGSMEPDIKVNSINIIKLCDISEIKENDIVCFRYNQDIIHRVIEVVYDNNNNIILHTKGDANEHADSVEINNDMVIGKVVKTFNGLAPYIDKYSIEPGSIDGATLSRNIIFLAVMIGIAVFIITWLFNVVIAFYKAFSKSDDYEMYLDRYISDIDELLIYRDLLQEIHDATFENKTENKFSYIGSKISKARAIMLMRDMHYDIKELKKGIKSSYYFKNLGIELDKQLNDESKQTTISDIIKNASIKEEDKT